MVPQGFHVMMENIVNNYKLYLNCMSVSLAERMEKEAEEERIRRQKAAAEKAFQDAVTKAKLVMRKTPLGTDRNHNRYWLFSDVVPGLYIEKGWVHESIDYTFTLPPEEEPVSTEEDEEVKEEVKKEEETEG